MSAYVPDEYLRCEPGSYRKVMLPWPEHLRPTVAASPAVQSEIVSDLPDIDAAALMKEPQADGVFFLMLDMRDRATIATSIERLIALLDALDGDENLEPSLGGYSGDTEDREYQCEDEGVEDDTEEENEHGGDIQDEPHDARDEGDDEPNLGRLESIHQGIGSYSGHSIEVQAGGLLHFDGDGYHDGQKLLRDLRERRPDKRQNHVRISRALGRRP